MPKVMIVRQYSQCYLVAPAKANTRFGWIWVEGTWYLVKDLDGVEVVKPHSKD